MDDSARLRAVPAPRAAQGEQGAAALRRRAGDAVDRARAAAQSEAAAARRAVAGPRAADRAGGLRVVVAMRKEGMSVLLVEQNVRAAVEIADRAYVLDDGRVVYEGPAAEFAKDEERVRALAGASARNGRRWIASSKPVIPAKAPTPSFPRKACPRMLESGAGIHVASVQGQNGSPLSRGRRTCVAVTERCGETPVVPQTLNRAILAKAPTAPFSRKPQPRHSRESPNRVIPAKAPTASFPRKPQPRHSRESPNRVIPAKATRTPKPAPSFPRKRGSILRPEKNGELPLDRAKDGAPIRRSERVSAASAPT